MPIWVLVLLLVCTCVGQGQVQVPCYGEGCVNVTVYLGPRWGSKVIVAPRSRTTLRPQHRPVPPGGLLHVDLSDDESSPPTNDHPPVTQRSPDDNSSSVVLDDYGRGVFDLSWRDYTGDEVKQVLNSLPESNRSRVNILKLDGNRVRHLPVLVFPVEFEYNLRELGMAYNVFNPSYLTSYSRFELSRLSSLQTLNMSHCGLTFISLPDLTGLKVLDLSYNALRNLPTSLSRLGNLRHLYLRGNHITYIPGNRLIVQLFPANLYGIDLGINGLSQIDGEPFKKLQFLNTIKLDQNKLTSLPQLDFENPKYVSLANNPLQCSCNLTWWITSFYLHLVDADDERCKDGDSSIALFDLRYYPDDYHHLCGEPQKGLLQHDVSPWLLERWNDVCWWFWLNSDILRTIFWVVVVVIFVVFLLVVMKRREKILNVRRTRDIPYNALDEQKISIVSALHADG